MANVLRVTLLYATKMIVRVLTFNFHNCQVYCRRLEQGILLSNFNQSHYANYTSHKSEVPRL